MINLFTGDIKEHTKNLNVYHSKEKWMHLGYGQTTFNKPKLNKENSGIIERKLVLVGNFC